MAIPEIVQNRNEATTRRARGSGMKAARSGPFVRGWILRSTRRPASEKTRFAAATAAPGASVECLARPLMSSIAAATKKIRKHHLRTPWLRASKRRRTASSSLSVASVSTLGCSSNGSRSGSSAMAPRILRAGTLSYRRSR
jgi:hypothetical protein